MDPVTGAVAIAGLKYIGPAASEVVKNFLNKVLSPAGDAIGAAVAQPIVEWQKRRVERAAEIITEAAALAEQQGAEPRAVPGRILMPLLERASVEDDPDLKDRWVRLLAGAATGASRTLPAYVAILSELSPEEVRLLDWVYRSSRKQYEGRFYFGEVRGGLASESLQVSQGLMPVIVGNLVRLGLVRHPIEISGYDIESIVESRESQIHGGYSRTRAGDFDAAYDEGRFAMTDLGGAFVEACAYGNAVPEIVTQ